MHLRRTSSPNKATPLMAKACFVMLWACALMLVPALATAEVAPHVPMEADTDVCAMCHRTHTSASGATWTDTNDTTHTALLVGTASSDVQMCYSCHGVEQLGSGTDVESSFESSSAHSLEPSVSAFGTVSAKQCSTCHDSHGSARDTSDAPYPALVRVEDGAGNAYYQGNDVCYSCHPPRSASVFPGKTVFSASPHAGIDAPASGTQIVCAACHDPHGSAIAPSLRTELATPSAPATVTVTGNDRTLCEGCHPTALGVWSGPGAFTGSSHESAPGTLSVDGEFAARAGGLERSVGACQSCHAVHGAVDASGTIVPNQLSVDGRALCDSCHRTGGAASTDFASLVYSPTTPGNEVVASWSSAAADAFSATQVFSREATAAGTPVGPREFSVVTTLGASVAGDLDGDGASEVVVSDLADDRVALFRDDALAAVKASTIGLPLGQPASLLSIGDVFVDGSGLPELVAVSASGAVDVARLSGSTLVSQAGASVPGTPTAVATGDVTGTVGADIAITTESDELFLVSDDGAGGLTVSGPFATRAGASAVRIADLDDDAARREIVVLNSAETTYVVSLFDGDGAETLAGGGPLPAGALPTALAVGDVFASVTPTGTSGAEIIVAYADAVGTDGIRVVEQPLTSATDISLPDRSNPGAVALGDANGDGTVDVAVANRGDFSRDASAVAPSISVLTPDTGSGPLSVSFTLPVGGAQRASTGAFVAITDLGAVVPSRHPVGAVPAAHESTETVVAPRHVECADCHNPHEARGDAADTATQEGELIGAWGITRESLSGTPERQAIVTREYEVCYSCHAQSSAPLDVASLVETQNASFHPIEGPSPETSATGSTLTAVVTSGQQIKCTACHGTSYAGPDGPHRSGFAPLLSRRYAGAQADDANALCVRCHRTEVYVTGTADGVGADRSGFYDTSVGATHPALHSFHATNGVTCASCHDSHGSQSRRAMLTAAGYTFTESSDGGQCASTCHTAGAAHSYTR